jgi:hypothetical protein
MVLEVRNASGTLQGMHLRVHRSLECSELVIGQYDQEGFQKDDGLPQTGIQIIMRAIHGLPVGGWPNGSAAPEILCGNTKVLGQVVYHLLQSADLVEELGTLAEKDAAQKIVDSRSSLSLTSLKIPGVQRHGVGDSAVVPDVFTKRAQQRG